jgi:hypothetical protein
VHPEPVIYREEVTAIIGALVDMSFNLFKIVHLLEAEFGEEEEENPEDDA